MGILNNGLNSISVKNETPTSLKYSNSFKFLSFDDLTKNYFNLLPKLSDPFASNISLTSTSQKPSLINSVAGTGLNLLGSLVSSELSNNLFEDSELGRGMGTLFSSGLNSTIGTLGNNLLKGLTLMKGLGLNAVASLSGAGAGLAANYMGQGITSLMGDSRLGRAVGTGFATGAGTIGGAALSGSLAGVRVGKDILTGSKGALAGLKAINPYGLGMSVVGSALGAATGPSKEYGGTYGGTTQTLDTIYDIASMGAAFVPGGLILSGAMVLNKGLSNIFGSTDGMTKTDAILGSAFMPAPVKWLNMWGSSKTGTFNNLSWLNSEKTNSFMGNSFGNLGEKFDRARREAGKTYGTFSQGAKRDALDNINFANIAWGKILAMANKNEYQNIRSRDMSSINNLRYALYLSGGWNPTLIGRQGMKILNNATNHNIGMRLLSGAALIDNKQMILCNVPD